MKTVAHLSIGKKFGRLTVLGMGPVRIKESGRELTYECRCECGKITTPIAKNVRRGITTSCGCYLNDVRGKCKITHGHCIGKESRTYSIWEAMRQRCSDPSIRCYPRYGGRGITVCERWMQFENFLADMGQAPDGLSIDRIDNDGNYEPENCRWADKATQSANRSSNRWVTVRGERMILKQAAAIIDIPYQTLLRRFQLGWSEERALTEPMRFCKHKSKL